MRTGREKSGWLNTGGVWYWLDSNGVLYDDGWRMVDGHKYYFHSNGQLAAGQYIGTSYYGSDGLRNPNYDMNIQGKRKPSDEEKEAVTKALENIPRQWMDRFSGRGLGIYVLYRTEVYGGSYDGRGRLLCIP